VQKLFWDYPVRTVASSWLFATDCCAHARDLTLDLLHALDGLTLLRQCTVVSDEKTHRHAHPRSLRRLLQAAAVSLVTFSSETVGFLLRG
jgi:hypothetical protein